MFRQTRLTAMLAVTLIVGFWFTTAWFALLSGDLNTGRLEGRAEMSRSMDCAECHQAIAEEWTASAHAKSARNDHFLIRMEVSGTRRDCLPCHAPRPVLRTGLANAVQARAEKLDDGVGCLACHDTVSGIVGRRTRPEADCGVRANAQFGTDLLCGSCHRSIYADVGRSADNQESKKCVECHMIRVLDRLDAEHTNHSFAMSPIGESVKLRARRGNEITVEVQNLNPAHAFPGESHNRVLLLKVDYVNAEGLAEKTLYKTIRDVDPFGRARQVRRIDAGETVVYKFPSSDASLNISLLYKRVPWVLNRDADVLQTVVLSSTVSRELMP